MVIKTNFLMRQQGSLLIAALSVIFLSSCEIRLEDSIEMEAEVGKPFTIQLPILDATGNSWYWEKNAYSDNLNKLGVIQEITNTRMRGKIGAEFWKFIADKKGDQALVFELKESADSEDFVSRKVYKISVN